MNALLPKLQTCLVRRYQARLHPEYWNFVDNQNTKFDSISSSTFSTAKAEHFISQEAY
jgi:predicted HD phosphohydrolase